MVSFNVKLLLTKVPFEKTVEIILERIYQRKEKNTLISKEEMKRLLTLCTKICILLTVIQFTDGVTTGTSLAWNIYGQT